jgi:hypothetical protein
MKSIIAGAILALAIMPSGGKRPVIDRTLMRSSRTLFRHPRSRRRSGGGLLPWREGAGSVFTVRTPATMDSRI